MDRPELSSGCSPVPFPEITMPYQATIAAVRQALTDIFAEVDGWFDRPEELRRFQPPAGGWSIDQILEHITLTNHFLMLVIRRWTEKAIRKAQRGEPVPEGESDLARLDIIGERGSFGWVRPEHMEPTGVSPTVEVREKLRGQVGECLDLLAQLGQGEGALCQVRMSVNGLGKIDLYQWLYFLAQHARRHLWQMESVAHEFVRASAAGANAHLLP
jgi:hypothetical protein